MQGLNKILSLFNIETHKRSSLAKHRLLRDAQVIGLRGACEAMSEYILGQRQGDPLIESFIRFYSLNCTLSRSQWSQDLFVMFFSEMSTEGVYLEVGGADGATHSNTLSLRDHLNWRGILVEPDPIQFELLKTVRGNGHDQLINAAIDPTGKNGTVQMRELGQLSSIVGHEGNDTFHEMRLSARISKKARSMPIHEILSASSRIDYFSLDVEGAEVSILRSIEWNNIKPPLLMTIEHNHREIDKTEIKSIMKSAGYKQVFASAKWLTKGDYWWIHEDKLNKLSPSLRDLTNDSLT